MSNISELAKQINRKNSGDSVVKAYMTDNTHCMYNGRIYAVFAVVPINLYTGKIVYISLLSDWKAIVVGD